MHGQDFLELFMEFRKGAKDLYEIRTHKLTKEEFSVFKRDNLESQLAYYFIPKGEEGSYYDNIKDDEVAYSYAITDEDSLDNFPDMGDDYYPVMCTRTEFIEAVEDGSNHLSEFFSSVIQVNYTIFLPKYINALDRFGYCDEYNLIREFPQDEELYQENMDYISYQNSYNLTGLGNERLINLYRNKFFIFLSLYFEMIMGYDESCALKLVYHE